MRISASARTGFDAIIRDVIAKPFSVTTLRSAVSEALTVRTRN
jgi:hypothetical protein